MRVVQSRSVYKGRVVNLRVDRVIEPGGIEATREVVGQPGSVVVLPRLNDGRIVMVRQFRYAVGRSLWELVAGGLEPGESILRAARRELLEETGYRAKRFKRLISFYPSPGFVAEQMHLVEAFDLALGNAKPEADERIEVGAFTIEDLKSMLTSKSIKDGKTLVGLLWSFLSAKVKI